MLQLNSVLERLALRLLPGWRHSRQQQMIFNDQVNINIDALQQRTLEQASRISALETGSRTAAGGGTLKADDGLVALSENFQILKRVLMQERAIDLVAMGPFLNMMFVDDAAYQDLHISAKNKKLIDQEHHVVTVPQRDLVPFLETWQPRGHLSPVDLMLACFHRAGLRTSFIDVGAHYGTFSMEVSLFAQSIGMALNHHAFECGITRELVRYNFSNNGFETRITLHDYAAGPVDNFVILRRDTAQSEGNRISDAIVSWDRGTVSVPVRCVTLDTLKRQGAFEAPLVLKVDTEGAEPAVLRGAKNLLSNGPNAMVLEFTPSATGPTIGVESPSAYLCDLLEKGYIFDLGVHHDKIEPVDTSNAADFAARIAESPARWTDIAVLDRHSAVCTDIRDRFLRVRTA